MHSWWRDRRFRVAAVLAGVVVVTAAIVVPLELVGGTAPAGSGHPLSAVSTTTAPTTSPTAPRTTSSPTVPGTTSTMAPPPTSTTVAARATTTTAAPTIITEGREGPVVWQTGEPIGTSPGTASYVSYYCCFPPSPTGVDRSGSRGCSGAGTAPTQTGVGYWLNRERRC